jgi:hypothetical protein
MVPKRSFSEWTNRKVFYSSLYVPLFYFIYVFETGSHYVAQAGLEIKILLLHPPKSRDYRHVPPSLAIFLYFLIDFIYVHSTSIDWLTICYRFRNTINFCFHKINSFIIRKQEISKLLLITLNFRFRSFSFALAPYFVKCGRKKVKDCRVFSRFYDSKIFLFLSNYYTDKI